ESIAQPFNKITPIKDKNGNFDTHLFLVYDLMLGLFIA
ncbi:MAG: hypothetical protein RLZZ384_708, partial [Pseudomonadota bacterium]